MSEEDKKHDDKQPLGVAVITPSGVFPNDDDYRRAFSNEKVEHILKQAAKHLHLVDTSDWVASVGERQIDPAQSFAKNKLACVVEIEWHKPEGGGGA